MALAAAAAACDLRGHACIVALQNDGTYYQPQYTFECYDPIDRHPTYVHVHVRSFFAYSAKVGDCDLPQRLFQAAHVAHSQSPVLLPRSG